MKQTWEERFHKFLDDKWAIGFNAEDIKAFIRSELQKQKEGFVEMIKGELSKWIESKNWSAVFSDDTKETVKRELLDDIIKKLEEL